jgi:hypothetical protein
MYLAFSNFLKDLVYTLAGLARSIKMLAPVLLGYFFTSLLLIHLVNKITFITNNCDQKAFIVRVRFYFLNPFLDLKGVCRDDEWFQLQRLKEN